MGTERRERERERERERRERKRTLERKHIKRNVVGSRMRPNAENPTAYSC